MEKKPLLKRILAVSLAVAVTVNGLTFSSLAEDNGAIDFKEVSSNSVSAGLTKEKLDTDSGESVYSDTDVVRVSIVLKDKSTIENTVENGYDIENIAENSAAMSYRSILQDKQEDLANKIEKVTNEDLDVVWNMTLAANIISANVEYGQIEAIEALEEVEEVLIETQHFPDVIKDTLPVDPNMSTSSEQTGAVQAWLNGYTGAGSRVAIIDTGTDDDHQSFSEEGYLHSLEELAKAKGVDYDEYVKSLNLLTWEEINSVKDQLNAGTAYNNQSSVAPITEQVYISAKLPFAYNYVDSDYEINHDNDTQGEHGSHVAGIATANSWIKKNGGFVKALEDSTVLTQGAAPDAQLITMKVFGKGGGAYDSDYMVAIEDAIVLNADAVNLSLGSGNPGESKSTTKKYQQILENLTKSGVVVSFSAGNSGYWVENAVNEVPYLYADDVSMQTDGSPGSYTNGLTVASVDNVGTTGAYIEIGGERIFYSESPDYNSTTGKGYKSLTTLAGEQEYVFIDGYGSEEEWDAVGNALKGRIAVCSRGNDISFIDKANWAIERGAIATIIYNNAPGVINMSGEGYKYSAPYVSITKEASEILRANAVENGTPVSAASAASETEAPAEDAENADAAEADGENESVETEAPAEAENNKVPEETEASEETEAPENTDEDTETAEETEAPAEDEESEPVPTADTVAGYVASLRISSDFMSVGPDEPLTNQQTMSSFSSWGVPGSLQLKPEITAPGGNIYSVNGLIPGGTSYENMSGTSMAAPQIAGMSALAAQYIRENKLDEKTGLSPRVLIQSLLMSTATPLIDEDGYYYPVIQQGAGLANINDVIGADSYILMNADATQSYYDGKIKVELGDDPDKKGVYTFSFTVNNLTDTAKEYVLGTDMFTQYIFGDRSSGTYYMHTSTDDLPFTEEYTVNGTKADSVTVPANGSAEVKVTVKIDVATLVANGYFDVTNGLYIEGYTYIMGLGDSEGSLGTVHSIPILGFLGNWTDPSMFDVGTYTEFLKGEESRAPYVNLTPAENVFGIEYAGNEGDVYLLDGANPVVVDDTYMPERSAINGNDIISLVQFTAIRNAANSRLSIINETNPEKSVAFESGAVSAAYFYENQAKWMNTVSSINIGTTLAGLGFKDGDAVTLQFTLAPEYYVNDSGDSSVTAWDKLGEGASFGLSLTVDNKKPEILRISLEEDGTVLRVAASDNRYVAGVNLLNKTGDVVIARAGSNPDAEEGELGAYYIPLDGVKGTEFMIQVYDYANNASTYSFKEEIGGDLPVPYALALNYNSRNDSTIWAALDITESGLSGLAGYAGCPANFVAATNADHYIFAVDENGMLYVMSEENIYSYVKIADLGASISDLAYNPVDKQIYGIANGGVLVKIDKLTGEITEIASLPASDALACDKDGNFFANLSKTGMLYTFTLDELDLAGVLDIDDSFGVGVAYGAQGLEIDPNTNHLYWYANTVVGSGKDAEYNYTLFEFDIDVANGTIRMPSATSLRNTALFGLVFVDGRPISDYDFNGDGKVDDQDGQTLLDLRTGKVKEEDISNFDNIDVDGDGDFDTHDAYVLLNTVLWALPTNEVTNITISGESVLMVTNGTYQLEANVTPWTARNRSVNWSSSDPSVASVDSNGLVTAKKAGTCVITAAASADRSLTVTCEITVENVEATLFGALQDVDGNPTFYEWNVAEDDTWTPTVSIDKFGSDITSAAIDTKGFVYISDGDGAVHKFNSADGSEVESAAFGLPLADMAYSYTKSTDDNPLFAAIYEAWLLSPESPMAFTGSGYNLTSYVANYGGSKFIALTSGGASQAETEDGIVTGEQFIAIDDAGNIYDFLLTDGTVYWDTYRYVLPAGFLGSNGRGEYCSLAYGTDGYLYLAAYDGNTANLYRIALINGSASASYFGNVGDGVWPATILTATGNSARAAAFADDVKAMSSSVSVSNIEASDENAESADVNASALISTENIEGKLNTGANITFGANDAGLTAEAIDNNYGIALTAVENEDEAVGESVSGATASGNKVELEVKAQVNNEPVETTNGLAVVKYSPEALKFVDAGNVDGVYSSYNADEENGVLVIAYATSLFAIPEGEPAQIVNFEIIDENLAAGTTFDIIHLELSDDNNTAVPEVDEEGNIKTDANGDVVYRVPPVTVDISSIANDADLIVTVNPELADKPVEIAKTQDPTPPTPDNPVTPAPGGSSGNFQDPAAPSDSETSTEAPSDTTAPAETSSDTAPAETTADNGGTTGGDSGSSSETGNVTGDVNVDTTAPVEVGNGDGNNGGNSSDADSNVGNVDGGNNAGQGDDKNQNTGVALFVAPAAVSALAVLVSKKKFRK